MDTHQKVYTFQKFMSVLITFVGINYEEMVLRTNPPFNDKSYVAKFISGACYHLPMKVLKQEHFIEIHK